MKVLNSINAREFVKDQGIPMSKSKLYKCTSSNQIPHRKTSGNKLIFYSDELTDWCNNQIINPCDNLNSSLTVIKSALKK